MSAKGSMSSSPPSSSPPQQHSQQQPPPSQVVPPLCAGPSGFILIMLSLFLLLVLFDPALRLLIGLGVGALLEPLIGFDGRYPVLTLFIAGVILSIITTSIRHKFTDWVQTAKFQRVYSAFQRELREAMWSKNLTKVKKLQELQSEFAREQSMMMGSQMKTMIFTMFIGIAIFIWLMVFIGRVPIYYATLPGYPHWSLVELLPICGPYPSTWLLLYMLFSIPFGIIFPSILKAYSFSKKLRAEAEYRRDKVGAELVAVQSLISELQAEGVAVSKLNRMRDRVETMIDREELTYASELLAKLKTEAEELRTAYKDAVKAITETERSITQHKRKRISVVKAEQILVDAKQALKKGDYGRVLRLARESMHKLRSERAEFEELQTAIQELKLEYSRYQTLTDAKKVSMLITQVENLLSEGEYQTVEKLLKQIRRELELLKTAQTDAKTALDNASNAIEELRKLKLEVSDELEFMLADAKSCLASDTKKSIELALEIKARVETQLKIYREAEETISFAKLVIANAREFGADVFDAQELLERAETEFNAGNFTTAKKYSADAVAKAEIAKREAKTHRH